ncbi:MAG: protein kinase [Elainellaceae cyanobacterium]
MISFDSAISDTELFDFDAQVLLGGRYQIIKQLAEGTFGHTYLARDWHLPDHPICVIKQLKSQSNGDDMRTAQRLFDSEARALATLGSHSQIPHLLAHFVDGEEFFLVQEYIKGRSLNNEIVAGTPWQESRVIALMEEILEVLNVVHQQQVIHRDIKPANLIRRYSDGRVVLIDFGAVKRASTPFSETSEGHSAFTIAIGTAGYIPKEQTGGRPRYSSDVYSTGIVGIQALTGVSPQQIPENNWSGELDWHVLAPHVSPELAQVLDQMVRYDFRDRFGDAAAALEAMRQLPAHLRSAPNPLPRLAEPAMLPLDGAPLPPTVVHTATPPINVLQRQEATLYDAPSVPTPPVPILSVQALSDQGPVPTSLHGNALRSTPTASTSVSVAPQTVSSPPSPQSQGLLRASYASGRSSRPLPYAPEPMAVPLEPKHYGVHGIIEFARCQLQQWRQRRLHLWYWASIGSVMSGLVALPLVQTSPLMASAAYNTNSNALLTAAERLVRQLPEDETVNSDAFLQVVQLISQATQQETDQQYTAALDTYRSALTIDSTNLSALWGRCRMLNALEQAEMALDACNDLLAVNASDVVGLWGTAKANSTMQLNDKALDLFNQALDQHLDFAPLWKDRAELLWRMGDQNAAIASLNEALALQPDYEDALTLRQSWGGG